MNLTKILFLFSLFACAHKGQTPSLGNIPFSESKYMELCDQKHNSACGRLGYHFEKQGNINRAKMYYERGCDLGDRSSCINKDNLNFSNNYSKKANGVLDHYSRNLANCHKSRQAPLNASKIQLKEEMVQADFTITVLPNGSVGNLDINTLLGDEFKKCAQGVFANMLLPKPFSKTPHQFIYKLTINTVPE
jgi:hypothetical protein